MKREPHQRLYTAEEFRAEAEKPNGRVLALRKEVAGEAKPNSEDAAALDFVLSTATPDRSNDVVSQDGWRLDNYRKNPVMLWAHDYSQLPVGKPGLVGVENGKLVAMGVKFPERDLYEHGWTVGEMYREGFLHAVSVGFAPVKYNWNQEPGRNGMDFHEQELLEFSAVPVPANPEALQLAKAAGLPLGGFIEWAERILDDASEDPSLVVRRGLAEQLYAAAKHGKLVKAKPSQDVPLEGLEAVVGRFEKSARRLAVALERFADTVVEEPAAPAPAPAPVKAAPLPPPRPSPGVIADAIGAEVARQLEALTGRKS